MSASFRVNNGPARQKQTATLCRDPESKLGNEVWQTETSNTLATDRLELLQILQSHEVKPRAFPLEGRSSSDYKQEDTRESGNLESGSFHEKGKVPGGKE